ncbi:MAG: hemerythrin [Bacteroidetes bacterium]|nr:MAG: hemerythrin [Bacteroidota bacterium]
MARVFVLWNEKYNTGIKEIDDQHKKLVNILNELYESFIDRTTNEKLKKVVQEMAAYTEYHFGVEEKYFKEFNYEGANEHIIEHQTFVHKVKIFKEDMEEGKVSVTFQLMNFLRSWLIEHINGTDRKYIELFKEKGL